MSLLEGVIDSRNNPLAVVEDTAAHERARYEAALILVRPDEFGAWTDSTASEPFDAAAILRRCSG